jgi:hypothetical protein
LRWYRAYLKTVEGCDYLVHRAAFWPPWAFLLRGVSPTMHGARVAATGDLRDYGLPALRCGKLLDLSVEENSRLERSVPADGMVFWK